MSQLFTGQNLLGRAINVEIGLDGGGKPRARWDMEITEGEHKGKIAKYSGKLNADNVKYTKRDMMLIGWKGEKSSTFVADVEKAKLVVPFNAEVASYNGNEWVSARFGGAAALASLDTDNERELDKLFASAPTESNGRSDIPF